MLINVQYNEVKQLPSALNYEVVSPDVNKQFSRRFLKKNINQKFFVVFPIYIDKNVYTIRY